MSHDDDSGTIDRHHSGGASSGADAEGYAVAGDTATTAAGVDSATRGAAALAADVTAVEAAIAVKTAAGDGDAPSEDDMCLDVPFFVQTTELNCGPTALRMALSFLQRTDDWDLSLIEDVVGIRDGRAVSTIRLAVAAARLGFPAAFRSTSLFFNEGHLSNPYYQQYGDMDLAQSKALVKEAQDAGVDLEERSLELEEILDSVGGDSIAIVLLDMNVVYGSEHLGYSGHFMPIVGYARDHSSILVHNQGQASPTPNLRIPRETFDAARRAEGTDEDVVLLRRPGSAAAAGDSSAAAASSL